MTLVYIIIIILLFIIHLINGELCKENVCEYYFEITEWITGMYGAHIPVWSENSTYYYYNESDNKIYNVPHENYTNIIGLDGYQRIIALINGSMPGPTIEVYQGTEIIVHINNKMANEATSFHWHGLYQQGTPWMDGVSTITQCAILPGQSFTYRFIANPIGTHWYHSHHGIQRPDGLFGALIIHQNSQIPIEENLHKKICNDRQSILIINEWFHQHNEDILLQRIGPGFRSNGPQKPANPWTFNIAGKIASETPFKSILFNGKGRIKLNKTNMETPLEYIYIDSTKNTHCFRIIHSGMERSIKLSIDQHKFILISSDGFDIEPTFLLDSLILTPGETYDFYINTTNKTIDNYWIRAKTLEIESKNEGWAILNYKGAKNNTLPITKENSCLNGCFVANCPFPILPINTNQTCLHITNFTNFNKTDNVITTYPISKQLEYFLNFEFGPLGVNRRAYIQTSSPLLTQYNDAINSKSFKSCNNTQCNYYGCNCTHILNLPFNYSIQMIFTNIGRYAATMHPIHLHGHSFQILHIGFPSSFNKTTGKILSNFTSDIQCIKNTDCSIQKWAVNYNKYIKPYLKLNKPIRKDTVVVMPGGYVIVRWITNNPGFWHLHCHMSQHLYWGLGMVINEAMEYSSMFPPPPNFPKCGNFDYKDSFMYQSIDAYNKLWP